MFIDYKNRVTEWIESKKSINKVDNLPKYGMNKKDKRELPYSFSNIKTHA